MVICLNNCKTLNIYSFLRHRIPYIQKTLSHIDEQTSGERTDSISVITPTSSTTEQIYTITKFLRHTSHQGIPCHSPFLDFFFFVFNTRIVMVASVVLNQFIGSSRFDPQLVDKHEPSDRSLRKEERSWPINQLYPHLQNGHRP